VKEKRGREGGREGGRKGGREEGRSYLGSEHFFRAGFGHADASFLR